MNKQTNKQTDKQVALQNNKISKTYLTELTNYRTQGVSDIEKYVHCKTNLKYVLMDWHDPFVSVTHLSDYVCCNFKPI